MSFLTESMFAFYPNKCSNLIKASSIESNFFFSESAYSSFLIPSFLSVFKKSDLNCLILSLIYSLKS